MSLTLTQQQTQIVIQTPCQYLRLALESVAASGVAKLMPVIDLIIFVDTRTIGREKMPFLFNANKMLCIYLTDGNERNNCNCISLNTKLSAFISRFHSLILRFNTSQVQQAMFWVKNRALLSLTHRELSVLYLLCKGLTVRQIAEKENIHEKTVYGRISSVKRKTNCRSTPVLVLSLTSHCDDMLKLMAGIRL
ncbi:helix-turn-helix transcriptional regulator [Enterobacter bugandensis]|nr:helix-turn-helix transcriptional regulator [Enterobacter bugandensis]